MGAPKASNGPVAKPERERTPREAAAVERIYTGKPLPNAGSLAS